MNESVAASADYQGKRVKVQWGKGEWFKGVVGRSKPKDAALGTWTIRYTDGDTQVGEFTEKGFLCKKTNKEEEKQPEVYAVQWLAAAVVSNAVKTKARAATGKKRMRPDKPSGSTGNKSSSGSSSSDSSGSDSSSSDDSSQSSSSEDDDEPQKKKGKAAVMRRSNSAQPSKPPVPRPNKSVSPEPDSTKPAAKANTQKQGQGNKAAANASQKPASKPSGFPSLAQVLGSSKAKSASPKPTSSPKKPEASKATHKPARTGLSHPALDKAKARAEAPARSVQLLDGPIRPATNTAPITNPLQAAKVSSLDGTANKPKSRAPSVMTFTGDAQPTVRPRMDAIGRASGNGKQEAATVKVEQATAVRAGSLPAGRSDAASNSVKAEKQSSLPPGIPMFGTVKQEGNNIGSSTPAAAAADTPPHIGVSPGTLAISPAYSPPPEPSQGNHASAPSTQDNGVAPGTGSSYAQAALLLNTTSNFGTHFASRAGPSFRPDGASPPATLPSSSGAEPSSAGFAKGSMSSERDRLSLPGTLQHQTSTQSNGTPYGELVAHLSAKLAKHEDIETKAPPVVSLAPALAAAAPPIVKTTRLAPAAGVAPGGGRPSGFQLGPRGVEPAKVTEYRKALEELTLQNTSVKATSALALEAAQAASASGVVVRAIVERAHGLREAMNHATEDAVKPLQDKRLALVFLLDNMIRRLHYWHCHVERDKSGGGSSTPVEAMPPAAMVDLLWRDLPVKVASCCKQIIPGCLPAGVPKQAEKLRKILDDWKTKGFFKGELNMLQEVFDEELQRCSKPPPDPVTMSLAGMFSHPPRHLLSMVPPGVQRYSVGPHKIVLPDPPQLVKALEPDFPSGDHAWETVNLFGARCQPFWLANQYGSMAVDGFKMHSNADALQHLGKAAAWGESEDEALFDEDDLDVKLWAQAIPWRSYCLIENIGCGPEEDVRRPLPAQVRQALKQEVDRLAQKAPYAQQQMQQQQQQNMMMMQRGGMQQMQQLPPGFANNQMNTASMQAMQQRQLAMQLMQTIENLTHAAQMAQSVQQQQQIMQQRTALMAQLSALQQQQQSFNMVAGAVGVNQQVMGAMGSQSLFNAGAAVQGIMSMSMSMQQQQLSMNATHNQQQNVQQQPSSQQLLPGLAADQFTDAARHAKPSPQGTLPGAIAGSPVSLEGGNEAEAGEITDQPPRQVMADAGQGGGVQEPEDGEVWGPTGGDMNMDFEEGEAAAGEMPDIGQSDFTAESLEESQERDMIAYAPAAPFRDENLEDMQLDSDEAEPGYAPRSNTTTPGFESEPPLPPGDYPLPPHLNYQPSYYSGSGFPPPASNPYSHGSYQSNRPPEHGHQSGYGRGSQRDAMDQDDMPPLPSETLPPPPPPPVPEGISPPHLPPPPDLPPPPPLPDVFGEPPPPPPDMHGQPPLPRDLDTYGVAAPQPMVRVAPREGHHTHRSPDLRDDFDYYDELERRHEHDSRPPLPPPPSQAALKSQRPPGFADYGRDLDDPHHRRRPPSPIRNDYRRGGVDDDYPPPRRYDTYDDRDDKYDGSRYDDRYRSSARREPERAEPERRHYADDRHEPFDSHRPTGRGQVWDEPPSTHPATTTTSPRAASPPAHSRGSSKDRDMQRQARSKKDDDDDKRGGPAGTDSDAGRAAEPPRIRRGMDTASDKDIDKESDKRGRGTESPDRVSSPPRSSSKKKDKKEKKKHKKEKKEKKSRKDRARSESDSDRSDSEAGRARRSRKNDAGTAVEAPGGKLGASPGTEVQRDDAKRPSVDLMSTHKDSIKDDAKPRSRAGDREDVDTDVKGANRKDQPAGQCRQRAQDDEEEGEIASPSDRGMARPEQRRDKQRAHGSDGGAYDDQEDRRGHAALAPRQSYDDLEPGEARPESWARRDDHGDRRDRAPAQHTPAAGRPSVLARLDRSNKARPEPMARAEPPPPSVSHDDRRRDRDRDRDRMRAPYDNFDNNRYPPDWDEPPPGAWRHADDAYDRYGGHDRRGGGGGGGGGRDHRAQRMFKNAIVASGKAGPQQQRRSNR